MSEFFALGIEEPFTLSAEHGYGFSDFMDALEGPSRIPPSRKPRPDQGGGGGTSQCGEVFPDQPHSGGGTPACERCGRNHPGFHRHRGHCGGTSFVLIDTAGIRRKARVSEKIEKFSVIKALKSLDECDVALIVIDAKEGITEQDVNVAGYAYERGCGCIFLLNKWDLVEKDTKTAKAFEEKLADAMKFMSFAPSITISATTGQRVRRIFGMIKTVYEQYETRIGTGQVNKVFEAAVTRNEPPMHKGKRVKYYYATQVGTRPPTFVCFVNYPEALHFSYQRYLMNQVRTQTGLTQTPLKILFRQRTGRIEFGDKKEHLVDHKKDRRKDPRRRRGSPWIFSTPGRISAAPWPTGCAPGPWMSSWARRTSSGRGRS